MPTSTIISTALALPRPHRATGQTDAATGRRRRRYPIDARRLLGGRTARTDHLPCGCDRLGRRW